MTRFLLTVLLGLATLAASPSRVRAAGDGDELAAVLKKAGGWESYTFTAEEQPGPGTGGVAGVRAACLPHEESAALARVVGAVKKGKEGGQTVYSAELSADGARALARPEHRGVAQGGSARFWVDGDGKLVKYAVSIKLQGK